MKSIFLVITKQKHLYTIILLILYAVLSIIKSKSFNFLNLYLFVTYVTYFQIFLTILKLFAYIQFIATYIRTYVTLLLVIGQMLTRYLCVLVFSGIPPKPLKIYIKYLLFIFYFNIHTCIHKYVH